MTKQEAIRLIIDSRIDRELLKFARLIVDNSDWDTLAVVSREEIKHILDSQGVVRKVKCPDCSWSQFKDEAVGMTPCHRCNSTGYIIEPLIKEVKV